MEKRNVTTLREQILSKGTFEFIDNETDSKGVSHTFVKLGAEVAYPSKTVQALLREKGIKAVDEIQYAEVLREEDGKWIPCLLSNNGGLKASVRITAADL